MKNIFNWKFFLLLIVIFAILLRFYSLAKIPGSLIPDELALGYTSFSLLKTGMDVHGNIFPISFNVFGASWTLIGYPIIEMVSIYFLGLTDFSVRAPSALAGIVGVVLIYFIAQILFKANKKISLLSALIFAISPWNIYFSRLGLEYNLALTVFLLGLLCFLNYIFVKNKDYLLILSIAFFSLTEFIYYPYVIFIPFFLIASFFVFKKIFLQKKKIFLLASLFFLITTLVTFVSISKGSLSEASTQSLFNDKNIIYERVERFRTDKSGEPFILTHLLHTKYLGIPYQIAQNYLNTFSPSFLFDKGGDKIERDIGYFGKLYLIDALFLIIGSATLFYKKEKNIKFLLIGLLLLQLPLLLQKVLHLLRVFLC